QVDADVLAGVVGGDLVVQVPGHADVVVGDGRVVEAVLADGVVLDGVVEVVDLQVGDGPAGVGTAATGGLAGRVDECQEALEIDVGQVAGPLDGGGAQGAGRQGHVVDVGRDGDVVVVAVTGNPVHPLGPGGRGEGLGSVERAAQDDLLAGLSAGDGIGQAGVV